MKQTRRPKIAVLGSINMDLMIRTENLPLPGETVIALSKVENPGGGSPYFDAETGCNFKFILWL